MNSEQAISYIEGLSPPDATYAATAEIGQRMLVQAVLQHDWRDLPEAILVSLAKLNEIEENASIRRCRGKGEV